MFVDDISMSSRKSKWSTVLNRLAPCILDFAKGVKELELSLSRKAMLVASHPKLAKMLQHEFANHSIELQIGKPKMGLVIWASLTLQEYIDQIGWKVISTKIIKIKKIQQLANLNRQSKLLFSSSALPASTWGHQAAGVARTTMQKLENDALGCKGIGRGRCHYSALVGFCGLFFTPCAIF